METFVIIRDLAKKIKFRLLAKKQILSIERQKETTSIIFDSILKRIPVEEIEKNIHRTVSGEVSSILKKLKEIGYVDLNPLVGPPTVSVVIPHFNHYEYLNEALFHLTKQTIIPDEVIVVDDISNNIEKVKQIVDSYKKDLQIKLILPKTKLYAGGCRQLGAEESKCAIVSMHDADDISHPNRIELTKYFFETNRSVLHLNFGLVRFPGKFFPYLKNFTAQDVEKNIITTEQITQSMKKIFTNQMFSVLGQPGKQMGYYGHSGYYFVGCHSGHVTYRRELSKIVKWTTPENFVFTKFEDYEFNFLLLLAAQKSVQLDLPLVYYRLGTTTNVIK